MSFFPRASRVSSSSSSRALTKKHMNYFTSHPHIVVPIAFTLAKIVASAKVKGKKEPSKKKPRAGAWDRSKKGNPRGGGPFYITNGSLKSFKRSRRESRAFSQRRRSNGREREKGGRSHRNANFIPLSNRERERESLWDADSILLTDSFPRNSFKKKKEEREERTELFRGDGPVAVFIEQSERFFEFGDLLVGEFSRHCCYFFF